MTADGDIPDWVDSLKEWRQGDYSLDVPQVLVVAQVEQGELVPEAGSAVGVAVITQTCDIVNYGPGRDWVVVAPLIKADPEKLENALRGSTPAFAILERPPSENVVVDLTQAMTLHKSVLAGFERNPGLQTDTGRSKFADAISRKYGRFAFPDKFSLGVLSGLRSRIRRAHNKDSDNGKTYKSIDTVRVVASPSWESPLVTVGFRFILAPTSRRLVDRAVMNGILKKLIQGITWPDGFQAEEPPFTLMTIEEMSAADWLNSQDVDWDFISISPKAV